MPVPLTAFATPPRMPSAPFALAVRVAPDDIDALGHVNNVVYLRWVQDVAVAHWEAAATPAQRESLAWVAVRHEIDYKHPAMPGDEIVVRTWVGTAEAVRFERHTEVRRARDERLLAKARTIWAPIDPVTGRVTRVGEDVRTAFSRPAGAPGGAPDVAVGLPVPFHLPPADADARGPDPATP